MTTKLHTRYKNEAGAIVPGCTTIIDSQLGWNKRTLMGWQAKMFKAGQDPDKVKDQAASRGTLAHYMIECHIKNISTDPERIKDYSAADIDAAETAYIAFMDWHQQSGIRFVASEVQCVSEFHQFGCTIDSIGVNGGRVIIDFKTGRGIYPEYKLQLAANTRAYEKCTGNVISNWYSLVVNRETGSFLYKRYTEHEIDLGWKAFSCCLDLYRIQKELQT